MTLRVLSRIRKERWSKFIIRNKWCDNDNTLRYSRIRFIRFLQFMQERLVGVKKKDRKEKMEIKVVGKVVAIPLGEAINGGRFDDFNLF